MGMGDDENSDMVTGGDDEALEKELMARRARADVLESRRAMSRCLLSSRCSGVKVPRGGLAVHERDRAGGGVMLASEAGPTEPKSLPRCSEPDSNPGQVKEGRCMPISILGSKETATALLSPC